jgi:uncharacterized membrane protein
MDAEIVMLRLLHILPGITWAGSAVFLAFILQPALKKVGPPHSGIVMTNMVKPMIILFHSSALLTVVLAL